MDITDDLLRDRRRAVRQARQARQTPPRGLTSAAELLRCAALARAMNIALVDTVDISAWLQGAGPYTEGAGNVPEVIVSRITALGLSPDDLHRELGDTVARLVEAVTA